MPIYTIQVADGRKVRIEAPDEASAIEGALEATAAPAKRVPPARAKAAPPRKSLLDE